MGDGKLGIGNWELLPCSSAPLPPCSPAPLRRVNPQAAIRFVAEAGGFEAIVLD
jgi:hypothetical protein